MPAFDGVRAVAVLLVVAFHTRPMLHPAPLGPVSWLSEVGWIGVDVFFTLSGFLITGILLRTRDQPSYFRNFYVRRVLRIFPLYYGLVTLILLPRLALGVASVDPWWSYYLFVSNFFCGRSPAEDFALDVTWSLAIEEQFYLVWPALVAFAPPRLLLGVVAAIVVGCPTIRALIHDPGHLASYSDTWSRLDALAIGALAAIAWQRRAEGVVRAARRLAWPAVALLIALVAAGVIDRQDLAWAVPGYTVVSFAVATILLALASGGAPTLARILAWGPAAHVGRVSYGLYLLHPFVLGALRVAWPLLPVPAPSSGPGPALVAYAVGPLLATAVATLVWRTIEAPVLALKDRLAPYGPDPR